MKYIITLHIHITEALIKFPPKTCVSGQGRGVVSKRKKGSKRKELFNFKKNTL